MLKSDPVSGSGSIDVYSTLIIAQMLMLKPEFGMALKNIVKPLGSVGQPTRWTREPQADGS